MNIIPALIAAFATFVVGLLLNRLNPPVSAFSWPRIRARSRRSRVPRQSSPSPYRPSICRFEQCVATM